MSEKPTIDDIKTELNSEKVKALIDEIRGTTPADALKKGVELIIKSDAEKAKIKAEEDKKLQEKIKKEKQPPEEDSSGKEERERDKDGKFIKKEPQTPEEQEEQEVDDKDKVKIDDLTKQMEAMGKEIEALKKQKNYRTPPPKAKKVDEVDDFIKQNITKDFEVVI